MTWGDPPVLMGILNATPDSFANRGEMATIARGREMIAQGAHIQIGRAHV